MREYSTYKAVGALLYNYYHFIITTIFLLLLFPYLVNTMQMHAACNYIQLLNASLFFRIDLFFSKPPLQPTHRFSTFLHSGLNHDARLIIFRLHSHMKTKKHDFFLPRHWWGGQCKNNGFWGSVEVRACIIPPSIYCVIITRIIRNRVEGLSLANFFTLTRR